MTEITWISVVGLLLLTAQLLNLFNSFSTAKKNANQPIEDLKKDVKEIRNDMSEMRHQIGGLKTDVDHAHDKIRENKSETDRIAKAQSEALVQILLLLRDPSERDNNKIDQVIQKLTTSI